MNTNKATIPTEYIEMDIVSTGNSSVSGLLNPPKETTTTTGSTFADCVKKWEQYALNTKFATPEAMELAKKEFMTKCMGVTPTGGSNIVEPDLTGSASSSTTSSSTTSTYNVGSFLGSLSGGAMGGAMGGGAGATEEVVERTKKKPFPYWLIVVALVGGYLIFKKQK